MINKIVKKLLSRIAFNKFDTFVCQYPNLQLLNRITSQSSQTQINCNSWDKGIYLLKIGTDNGVFLDKISIQ